MHGHKIRWVSSPLEIPVSDGKLLSEFLLKNTALRVWIRRHRDTPLSRLEKAACLLQGFTQPFRQRSESMSSSI